VDRTASQPNGPWPVSARALLTARERAFYDSLNALYPSHRLFIQVALSQLVNVHKKHPAWKATRNRIDKLVADFVLCRPDLSIVTVIELDDWSHKLPGRPEADARKSKALAGAGLRLIRIPDGPLPLAEDLRRIIDNPSTSEPERPEAEHEASPIPQLHLMDDQLQITASTPTMDHEWQAHKAVWVGMLKFVLVPALLICGWYAYIHVMPDVVRSAFQPMATPASNMRPPVPKPPTVPWTASPIPSPVAPAPGPSKADLEAQRDADHQAAQAARKGKQLAWAAFFKPAASCDHPVDWNAQVECGNQYMRAKQAFEAQWARAHGDSAAPSTVVIDNHSFEKPKR
jgi:very-short-patch-repair endonuclease